MSEHMLNGADFVRSSMQHMPQQVETLYRQMRPEYGPQDQILRAYNTLEHLVETDSRGNRFLRMHFDMRNFRPEEVKVKTEGRALIIQAYHVSPKRDSMVTDEYTRCYTLPSYIDVDTLTTRFTNDGSLHISARATGALYGSAANGRGLAMADGRGSAVQRKVEGHMRELPVNQRQHGQYQVNQLVGQRSIEIPVHHFHK